jgi:hypothetical protein
MLAQDTAEIDTPNPLSEEEKGLIQHVKRFMVRQSVSLPELTSEIGVEINTLRSLTRIGMGIDEDPSMLPLSLRTEAIQKLSDWVNSMESEDETLDRVERRMAGFHTITSLAKRLDLSAPILGQLLSRQTHDWSAGEHAYKRKMLGVLSAWLDSDSADDIAGIATTPTFISLQNAYDLAWATKGIVVVVGEVGIGKSLGGKRFCRQNPKTSRSKGVVYVEFKSGEITEKAILGRIVSVLYGQGLISTTSGDPTRIIEDTLDSDDLLLLDEFHFTIANGNRGGEVFHSLYNAIGMPIVLQGNATLNGTLWNDKKQPFQGLANRALCMPHMSTTVKDVETWMHWAGYDNDALIRAAVKIGARPGQSGGLRTLAMVIKAIEIKRPGEKLTATALLDFAAYCGKPT